MEVIIAGRCYDPTLLQQSLASFSVHGPELAEHSFGGALLPLTLRAPLQAPLCARARGPDSDAVHAPRSSKLMR